MSHVHVVYNDVQIISADFQESVSMETSRSGSSESCTLDHRKCSIGRH